MALKKILVPIDGSALSSAILGHVRRLLVRSDATVSLLRVVAKVDEVASAQSELEKVRDDLAAQGATATARVFAGDPATKILEYANEVAPALIAMSTHGRTGLARFLRGSVAERVLRASPVPVLLSNPHTSSPGTELRFKKILVPLDGSELAERILPLVADLAKLYGSELVLASSVEIMIVPDPSVAVSPIIPREKVEQYLEGQRARLAASGFKVSTRIGMGGPAVVVLDLAREIEADLIAMTTHGRTGISHWAYGSVAEQVVRHATQPVLVQRTVVAPVPERVAARSAR